jgi:hypothetical protein
MNVSTVNVNVILLLKTLLAQHTTLNYSFHISSLILFRNSLCIRKVRLDIDIS